MDEGGLTDVTRLADARAQLRDHCEPVSRTERLPVSAAANRVLADSQSAQRAVPPEDAAATDGYAVSAEETHGASDRSPVRLSLADTEGPATTPAPVESGRPLPPGADAVVPLRHTERRAEDLLAFASVASGEHVREAGADVDVGATVAGAGQRLGPTDLALLDAAGSTHIPCRARPRVALVALGSELAPADADPAAGESIETNSGMLDALVEHWSGKAETRDVVPDDRDAIREAFETATERDVVVTVGGSGCGTTDLTTAVLGTAGDLCVHGLAMEPGRSAGFGVMRETPVVVLPGDPISCFVAATQLLRPCLQWRTGTPVAPHPTRAARLRRKVPSAPGKRTFARVAFPDRPDELTVEEPADSASQSPTPEVDPLPHGDGAYPTPVAERDGWVVVPEASEGVAAGEAVTIQCWEGPC